MDDQQIPDSLEVSQSTQVTTSAGVGRQVEVGMVGVLGVLGVLGMGAIWIL